MQVVDKVSVVPVEPDRADRPRESLVHVNGQTTGTRVPGNRLEAAVETSAGWLLFSTDDVPFEEGLHVCLLDRDSRLVDRATLLWPNSTGTFRDLQLISDSALRFRFFGGTPWQLDLSTVPRFRVPFLGDPRGVWRPFGFRRHFSLRRLTEGDESQSRRRGV